MEQQISVKGNEKSGNWFRSNLLWLILLGVSLAFITSYFHHYTYISSPNSVLVSMNHVDVVSFEAKAPLQYRLAPYLIAQGLLNAAVLFGAPNNSDVLMLVYCCIRVIILTFCYLALLGFLGIWFDIKSSILGLLFLVAVNPLAEYFYFHQPGDPWMLLFFILGYTAIAKKLDLLLIPIILIGVPFHESTAFLIPAYLFARLGNAPLKSVIIWTVVLVIAWAVPVAGLRMIFGILPEIMAEKIADSPYTSVFDQNLRTPRGWLMLLMVFNVMWFAVPAAWKQIPDVVRRMFGMVIMYLVAYQFAGHNIEGRHFMPLLPLFIVGGLTWLERADLSGKSNKPTDK